MSLTSFLKIVKPAGEYDAQKTVTINTGADDLDGILGGVLIKALTGNVTLTRAEALRNLMKFTGTGSFTVSIDPALGCLRTFMVWNATTGTLTVKLTTGGSVGKDIAADSSVALFHDGTNVYYAGAEVTP